MSDFVKFHFDNVFYEKPMLFIQSNGEWIIVDNNYWLSVKY